MFAVSPGSQSRLTLHHNGPHFRVAWVLPFRRRVVTTGKPARRLTLAVQPRRIVPSRPRGADWAVNLAPPIRLRRDLQTVLGGNCHELGDIAGSGWRCDGTFRRRLAHLLKHLLESGWRDQKQDLGRGCSHVLEPVEGAFGNVEARPSPRKHRAIGIQKLHLALLHRVAPHLGAGLRAAALSARSSPDVGGDDICRVVILDHRGRVLRFTGALER